MAYRVTPNHFASNTVRWSQAHTASLSVFQTQISTGLRIQKPSDDPSVMGTLLANKSSLARLDIDQTNITAARAKLDQSVAQLVKVKEALTRANSLALQSVQASEEERRTLAGQVDGILDLILQIANSSDGGKPLYAGTADTSQPFVTTNDPITGDVQDVIYRGSETRSRIVIGVLSTVDAMYTGSEVFLSRGRGETLLMGDTGLAAGRGTDTDRGFNEIQIRRTATTISGASGLQSGVSVADDTLIGQHTLSVDGTQMTLRLDGGSPTSFVKGDNDILVTSPSGAVVHIDSSTFVDGFIGDITISGAGTLSIDGGASTTPIDFTDNQVVTNSVNGNITYVDTQQVVKTGDVPVEYQDTANIFTTLIELRDDLLNRRDLAGSQWQDAIQRRIGDVQQASSRILEVVGDQSVSLDNLDGIEARVEIYRLETERAVGDRESADIASAIVQLQNEQNMLQFTYAVSSQVMSISILDYLR